MGARLEGLLQAYTASLGAEGPGVPSELLQTAARIDEARASIHQHGPGDAVPSDSEGEAGDETVVAPDESAAVLEGGIDDVSPLQWWDSVMRKYGVMQ